MVDVSSAEDRQSKRNAAIVVVVIAACSLIFIGLVSFLDATANHARSNGASLTELAANDPFYVLLIGSDSRKGTALYTGKGTDHAQVDQHSDVMTLLRVDPDSYTLTLVTIPRDTVLEGSSSKINDALLTNDPREVVRAAENLVNVPIDYYMMTTFTSFEMLIDAMGGVCVDVPRDVAVPDPLTAENVSISAGDGQDLEGAEALVLARARKEYGNNQDALRQVNVRNIEIAMLQKMLSVSDEERANDMLLDLEDYTSTDLDMSVVGYLAIDFVTHKDEVTIYSCTGPYAGGENAGGMWVVSEDFAAWERLMAVVDSGGDPVDIIEPPSFE